MSRIRSQLDYLMGGQETQQQAAPRRAFEGMAQQAPQYPQPQQPYQQHGGYPAPQHGYPQPPQYQPPRSGTDYLQGYAEQPAPPRAHAYQPAPQPAPQPAAQPQVHTPPAASYQQPAVSHEEMDKLHEGLNQLARKIQSLPRILAKPDTSNQGEQVIGEVRNGFAQAQKEMHRIAEAINALQQTSNVQPRYVEQMQTELHNLHSSMNKLLDKPDPHFDLSGVSRSIETGYSEIVDRLDNWLTTRQTPQIELPEFPEFPDYSSQFDNLNRKVEEVTRAMVSMSVSAGASEDRAYFERLEARLTSLAKSVDDVIATGASGAPSSQLVNQLQLIDRKLDNMSAMEAAGAQLSGGVDGIVTRLDRIQNDMGVLAQSLEAAQSAPEGGFAAFAPFDVGSMEEKLTYIRSQVENIARSGGNSIDETGPEILSTLRDLVQRVETLETRPMEMPAIDDSRFASLEEQLREITGQLQTTGAGAADLGPITERLDNLEGQIVASRDIVIDMANQSAKRGGEADGGQNAAILSAMMEEIQNLKAMASSAAPGSAAAPVADERIGDLMDSVSAIASRLDTFEAKLDARPAETQPAPAQRMMPQHAPEYEAMQAHRSVQEPVPAPASQFEEPHYDYGRGAAPSAYAQVEAPSIDMSMNDGFGDENLAGDRYQAADGVPSNGGQDVEDIPLAPGSGMPDLEALVRKAAHRKKGDDAATGDTENISELMAAARRAAQAATAEAESLKADADSKKTGRKTRAPASTSKFNTRYLMYAGAAAIIAFGAYSFVPKLLSGFLGGGQQASSIQRPANPASGSSEMAAVPSSGTEGSGMAASPEDTAVNTPSARQIPMGGDSAANQAGPVRPIDEEAAGSGDGLADAQPEPANPDMAESAPVENTAPAAPVAPVKMAMPPEEIGNGALRNAAATGDADALFEVGRRYTDGDHVDRNLGEAAKWYELAANAGNAPAQYRLGNFYEKGHGVKQDPQLAADWYEKAAAQGNALAMHNLAVLHAMGVLGGEPDMPEAITWFRKAADLGVKDSQVNLGILYTKGMGVEENLEEAYKWFAIASRAGDADASKKRDTVAQAMRPEQLEKARGMAELWKPKEISREANIATVRPEWESAPAASAASVSGKEMIRQVQTLLAKAGYDAGPADGVMGAKTRDAIISFQKKTGMNADGQVSGALLEALSKTSI